MHLSPIDQLIVQFDRALRTLTPSTQTATRPSPAMGEDDQDLSERERKHAAGLMRINHCGEVCAQALYQGQGLTAKLAEVKADMEHAADEEIDHLAWCEERLNQLNSHTSYLNPLWYTLSFGIGASAGKISDKVSLGFVAATEEQVSKHLRSHLTKLPQSDKKSRAILEQMLEDEEKHGDNALRAGGLAFPGWIKRLMSGVAKIMTTSAYRV